MSVALRVLVVEDWEDDAVLIARALRRGGYDLTFERVDTAAAMRAALAQGEWDVVIADYAMPRFNGLDALTLLQESGRDLPFIIVSGTIGEETAVAAMRAGAHDYVMKDNLTRLVPAVRRELQEARVRQARRQAETALRESERQYRTTLDAMSDLVHVVDADLRIVLVNQAWTEWCRRFDLELDVIGRKLFDVFHFLPERVRHEYARVFETGEMLLTEETTCIAGQKIITETRKIPIFGVDKVERVVTALRDITASKHAEQALRQSEARNRALLTAVPDLIFQFDREGTYLDVISSPNLTPLLSQAEMMGKKVSDILPPEVAQQRMACIAQALESGEVQVHEYCLTQDSERVDYEARIVAVDADKVLAIVRDISQRVQAEQEKAQLLGRKQRQHTALANLATHPALIEGRLAAALQAVTRKAAETLRVERVNVWQLTPDDQALRCLASFASGSGSRVAGMVFPITLYPRYLAALREGRAMVVRDVRDDPRTAELTEDYWAPSGVVATIETPIRLQGQVVGMICHEHVAKPRAWMSDEINFAGQVAALVAQAFLTADLRRRAEELAAITRVSREITSVTDLQQVFDSIARHAAQLCHSDACGVFAFRPDGCLYLEAAHGVGERFVAALNAHGVPLGEGAVGRAADTSRPAQILDTHTEPDYRFVPLAEMENIRTILAVPMQRDQEVIGGVVLWHRQPRHFVPEEVAFLQALAQQCVNAIENARLFEAQARRRREAETLRAATQALSATLELQRVFELILSELQQVVPYDCASVQQLKGEQLEIIGGRGFPNLEELLGVDFDLDADDNPNHEVIRTRAPLILKDAPTLYAGFRREPHAQACIRSWLGVPLLFGDRLIGMIALDKQEPGFYTEEHARLAMAFAAQAAIALENARLFQQEQQRRREAEVLREASLALGATLEVDEVLERLLEQVSRVIPYDGANVTFIEGEGKRVVHQRGYGDETGETPLAIPNLAVTETPTLYAMISTQQPFVVSDVRTDPDWIHCDEGRWVRSWVGAPIVVRDVAIGFFSLDSKTPHAYTQEHAELLAAFATHAALAIENAQMFTKLTHALTQQRELAELKSEFMQNVSHELRTPLAIARGYAELLDTGAMGKLRSEQREPVAIIARRMRMVTKLMDDFDAILAAETRELERKAVNLAEMVYEQLADFQDAAEKAELELLAQVMPDPPPVLGDVTHLRRVLDNLLGNALKFTPAGGRITVRLEQEGQNLVLEVADTGLGIPQDQLERIFERFYQVDGSMSRRFGGAGLGLALVKEIAKAHGGSVGVHSDPGQGSTFRVTLPVSAD